MEKQNILSVPVLDENRKLVAFVDVLDIIIYITRIIPASINWNIASEDQLDEFKSLGRKFDETTLKEVIGIHRVNFPRNLF